MARKKEENSSRKVLVVDDDAPIRGLLSAALHRAGYKVLLASDGEEAENALSVHEPDIILLDLMMPRVSGWDVIAHLRQTGKLGRIPVVIISAHLRSEPEALLKMGVDAILPKPFQIDELLILVDSLVQRKRH